MTGKRLRLLMRRAVRAGIIGDLRSQWHMRNWQRSGRVGPPPHRVKIGILTEYRRRFDLNVLVETGTYLGDTVQALLPEFRRIHTIELDAELARAARRRFRRQPQVEVLEGDSAVMLPSVLGRLEEPALFWLDAHYSGGVTAGGGTENPILRECRAIMRHPLRSHVLLVDDARCFDGTDGYPELAEVGALVRSHEGWSMSVEDDLIRICPPAGAARPGRV